MNLKELRSRVEEARRALEGIGASPLVSRQWLRLQTIQNKLGSLEKTPAPVRAAQRKEKLRQRRALLEEAAEFSSTVKGLKTRRLPADAGKNSLMRYLSQFREVLNAFSPLYDYITAMIDRRERRLAVSPTGDVYSVSTEDIKHVYCIGGTGSGKSKLFESLITQDLIAGRGGCLIDPFGGLYREVAAFCYFYEEIKKDIKRAQEEFKEFWFKYRDNLRPLRHDRLFKKLQGFAEINLDKLLPRLNVKMIDLSEEANKITPNPYRINPFQLEKGEEIHHLTETLIKSVERHTGQSSEETPQLSTVMEGLFSYMIENKKDIGELLAVIDTLISYAGRYKDGSLRVPSDFFDKLENSDNPTAKQGAWSLKFLLQFPHKDFINSIHSLANRLRLFNNPINHSLLNTPETTLKLEREMNSVDENGRRPFLLFNIPTDDSKARMAATFLLTKMDKIIRQRKDHQKKFPFFVYIDEFHEFIDKELARNFAKVRQFGLGYIVAHQNMAQLRQEDPDGVIAETIFDNTAVQMVMRVKHQAAEYMAQNCFRITGKMEKKSFTTSEGGNEVTGYNLSQTQGNSKSRSTTKSKSESENWSKSFSKTAGKSVSKAIGTSSSVSAGTSLSQTKGTSASRSDGSSSGTTENTGHSYGSSNSSSSSRQIPTYSPASLDGNTSNGSVIGSSSQYSSGHSHSSGSSHSESFGESESKTTGSNRSESSGQSQTDTTTNSNSETEGKSEGVAKTFGESEQEGISESFAKTYGMTTSLGKSDTKSVKTEFLGVDEERQLLAQEIQGLASRELFVCFPQLITYKAATFDSLVLQLSKRGYLGHLEGENFYPYLLKAQDGERKKMLELLEKKKAVIQAVKELEYKESLKKEDKKTDAKDYKKKMF